jgi:iron complex transport system ATP-binding protein
MGEVTLRIENVECRYGSARILENISFDASGGDFIGLIGPNGSGKTTLLRSISRILKPHIGTVLLDGRDVYSLKSKEVAKKVAVVPQDTATSTFLFTALEIVLMGRTPHLGWLEQEGKKDYTIAKNAMNTTNTWHLADRPFTELSGGEKQRVIIARALTQEPKVLLLDEPTSHLDINYQVEILNLIKKLSEKEKLTIVAVFHDLNLAAQYCDYLILLNQGEIESIGAPEVVLTPENIKRVYHAEVLVKRHPITNSLYLIPFSGPKLQTGRGFTVHLICGAGTGAPLMSDLLRHGYRVTTGVLSTLDTDYETSTYLNIPVVTDPPFSPADEEAYRTNLKFVEDANVVVLTDMQIGWGNMKNLKAAAMALKKGIPLIMIEKTPFGERDFTGGEAQKDLNDLKQRGAICVKNLNEVLPTIDKLKGAKSIAKIKKRHA